MGLATYDRVTGEVRLEVKKISGMQETLYDQKIGQLTPEQLQQFTGDTTAFGNYIEGPIREMISEVSRQLPDQVTKNPSANGPDWLPLQFPLPWVN